MFNGQHRSLILNRLTTLKYELYVKQNPSFQELL
jgi:hypothetical protein